MLSRTQFVKYSLPAVPDWGRAEESGGWTELHALEAAKPNLAGNIVEKYLSRYLDINCVNRMHRLAGAIASKIEKRAAGGLGDIQNLCHFGQVYAETPKEKVPGLFKKDQPWLYDSARDYLSQLISYQLQKMR